MKLYTRKHILRIKNSALLVATRVKALKASRALKTITMERKDILDTGLIEKCLNAMSVIWNFLMELIWDDTRYYKKKTNQCPFFSRIVAQYVKDIFIKMSSHDCVFTQRGTQSHESERDSNICATLSWFCVETQAWVGPIRIKFLIFLRTCLSRLCIVRHGRIFVTQSSIIIWWE